MALGLPKTTLLLLSPSSSCSHWQQALYCLPISAAQLEWHCHVLVAVANVLAATCRLVKVEHEHR